MGCYTVMSRTERYFDTVMTMLLLDDKAESLKYHQINSKKFF
jgi:hypothetical protein